MNGRQAADGSLLHPRIPRSPSRWARRLANLGLVLAGSIVALVTAEVAVRMFAPHARDHVVPSGMFEIDRELGWALAANWSGVHRSRYFEAEYRSNQLGFRDNERGIGRSRGRYRIVVYGDSQVFGWGLSPEERFTNILETRLGELELWNVAVPGYGLGQEVIVYETRGFEYRADEVAFFVNPLTLHRIPFDYIFRKPKPRFRLDDAEQLLLDPVDTRFRMTSDLLYRLLSPFYLPYFVEGQLARLRDRAPEARRTAPAPRRLDEVARRILLRAKAQAAENGQRMSMLTDFGPDGFPELWDFAEANEIGLLRIELDPTDANLRFGPLDRHWNAHANRLIAEQLQSQIRDRLEPRPPASDERPTGAH